VIDRIIYFLLVLAGFILLSFAIIQYKQSRDLLSIGIKAKATVVKVMMERVDKEGRKNEFYRPVFEFTTNTYEVRQFIEPVKSKWSFWEVGDEATIIYNPFHPEQVKVITYWGLFRWPILLLSAALPLLVFGGTYFIFLLTFKNTLLVDSE
jgi:hypothetical protein